jgi:hypothetical protein
MSWRFCVIGLSLLLMGPAQAQAPIAPPTCWLVSGATGYVTGTNADGRYAAWYCPTEWGWSRVTLVMRPDYVLNHPALPAGASATDTAVAYWNANVNFNCAVPNRNDPALLRLCDLAYNDSLNTRPLSRWIVAPYPGATYRATYPTSLPVDGVRNKTSNGRVLITTDAAPTPCLCVTGRVVETSTTGAKATYCAVAASAPQSVASCRLR